MQPSNEDELVDMIATGIEHPGPAFIRYPRGAAAGVPLKEEPRPVPIGKAAVVREGSDVQIWALGPMVSEAEALASRVAEVSGLSVGVVNARFAKPIDSDLLRSQAAGCRLVVTLEDHVRTGGFGSAVLEDLADAGVAVPVERIGWPDRFVDHGDSDAKLRADHGLDPNSLFERVLARLEGVEAGGVPQV
jgi:1-deoxy-D-xylulose-5-phosphate synthase